jgi:hypothetical protein
MGYLVKNRRLQSGSNGIVIPTGNSAQRPDIPNFGMIRFNTDLGLVEFFNGTVWDGLSPGGSITYTVDDFTGDGVTTTFTMSVAPSNSQQIIVFVGSIYQDPATSYTVSGLNIIFTSAPPNTVPVNVIHSTT